MITGCATQHKSIAISDKAGIFGQKAYAQFNSGDFIGAIANYKKAYIKARQLDLPDYAARYLFNLGRVYYEMGKIDSATVFLSSAYHELILLNDTISAGSAAGFLALNFARAGIAESAVVYLEKGRATRKLIRKDDAFFVTIQGLLNWYKQDLLAAGVCFDSAIVLNKNNRHPHVLASVLFYRARVYMALQDYEKSKPLLDSALLILSQMQERYRIWQMLLSYSKLSFCQKDTMDGKRYYTRAVDCAPKGILVPHIDSVMNCSYFY